MTKLMLYIKSEFEETTEVTHCKFLDLNCLEEGSIMKCFIPILIFAFLYLGKICLFKTKNTAIQVAVGLSIISSAFVFESHFDENVMR